MNDNSVLIELEALRFLLFCALKVSIFLNLFFYIALIHFVVSTSVYEKLFIKNIHIFYKIN